MWHDNSITTLTDYVTHNTEHHITSTADAERQNIYATRIIHTKNSRAITENAGRRARFGELEGVTRWFRGNRRRIVTKRQILTADGRS